MKTNKNSDINKKLDRSLKSGVVLGATLLASNFAGVISAHAVEAPKTITPVSTSANTIASISKNTTKDSINQQISKEILDKYTIKSSNLSICQGDTIEAKDINFCLFDEKGRPVDHSLYTWEKVKDNFPPDPTFGGISTVVRITLKTGESFERSVPVSCVYADNLKTGKVIINKDVTLNVKVGDNVNEQYKEDSINTIIRKGIYDNHEGKLLVETLTDVNTSPVNCKATLFTKDGKAYKSECKVGISVIPADKFHDIIYNKNGEGLFVISSSSTNVDDKFHTSTVITETETKRDNHFPIISGNDLNLDIGDNFNIQALRVTAHDNEDGDLTKFVKMSGENKVDTSAEGIYEIKTWVDDKDGAETVRYFKIHVSDPKSKTEDPVEPKEDTTKPDTQEKVTEKEKVSYPNLSVYNFSINKGDKITNKEAIKLSNAKADDKYDGDITSKIEFDSLTDIKTSVPGTYRIIAYIVNSKGMKTKSYVTVTVDGEKTASLTINVVDNKTGDILDTSTSYKLKVGSTITSDMIPDDIMKDYTLVRTRINGLEDKTISGVIIPNENIITLYINKNNKTTVPVEKPKDKEDDAEIKKEEEKENNTSIDNIIKNTPPTIVGKNIKLKKGDTFRLSMLELKALDIEDGDITDNIETISSNIDTSKIGNYMVSVSVKDKNGEEVTKDFHVDVEDTKSNAKAVKASNIKKNEIEKQKDKPKDSKSETVKSTKNSEKVKLYKTGIDSGQSRIFAWLGVVLSLICAGVGLLTLTKNKKGLKN